MKKLFLLFFIMCLLIPSDSKALEINPFYVISAVACVVTATICLRVAYPYVKKNYNEKSKKSDHGKQVVSDSSDNSKKNDENIKINKGRERCVFINRDGRSEVQYWDSLPKTNYSKLLTALVNNNVKQLPSLLKGKTVRKLKRLLPWAKSKCAIECLIAYGLDINQVLVSWINGCNVDYSKIAYDRRFKSEIEADWAHNNAKMESLLKKGVEVDVRSLLLRASRAKDEKSMEIIIKHCSGLEGLKDIWFCMLCNVIENQHQKGMKILLDNKVNLGVKHQSGNNIFHYVGALCSEQEVKFLIKSFTYHQQSLLDKQPNDILCLLQDCLSEKNQYDRTPQQSIEKQMKEWQEVELESGVKHTMITDELMKKDTLFKAIAGMQDYRELLKIINYSQLALDLNIFLT